MHNIRRRPDYVLCRWNICNLPLIGPDALGNPMIVYAIQFRLVYDLPVSIAGYIHVTDRRYGTNASLHPTSEYIFLPLVNAS